MSMPEKTKRRDKKYSVIEYFETYDNHKPLQQQVASFFIQGNGFLLVAAKVAI